MTSPTDTGGPTLDEVIEFLGTEEGAPIPAVWFQHMYWEAAHRFLSECTPFLKEGESPKECIERNRADADAVLALLANARRQLSQSQERVRELEAALEKIVRACKPESTLSDRSAVHYCEQVAKAALAHSPASPATADTAAQDSADNRHE
jgi:hypothetical protein